MKSSCCKNLEIGRSVLLVKIGSDSRTNFLDRLKKNLFRGRNSTKADPLGNIHQVRAGVQTGPVTRFQKYGFQHRRYRTFAVSACNMNCLEIPLGISKCSHKAGHPRKPRAYQRTGNILKQIFDFVKIISQYSYSPSVLLPRQAFDIPFDKEDLLLRSGDPGFFLFYNLSRRPRNKGTVRKFCC